MDERLTILDIDFDSFIREPMILDWGHREAAIFQDMLWHPRAIGWANHPQFDLGEILTPPNGPHPDRFWDRLIKQGWKFDPDCIGLAADSHGTVGKGIFEHLCRLWPDHAPVHIIHIDAHHDLGYSDEQLEHLEDQGMLSCDSWLYLIAAYLGDGMVEKISVVYPEWRREPCPITKKRIDEGYEELLQRRAEQLDDLGCELEVIYWNDLIVPADPVNIVTVAQSSAWVPPWYDSQFEALIRSAPCDVTEQFGPDLESAFQRRPNWADSWAGVKEMYLGAMSYGVGE